MKTKEQKKEARHAYYMKHAEELRKCERERQAKYRAERLALKTENMELRATIEILQKQLMLNKGELC